MARAADRRSGRTPRRRTAAPPAGGRSEAPGTRIAFGPVNYALFAAAAAAIVVGYALLAGGSITLAPILLVLGYVVLLPAAILLRGKAGPRHGTGE